MPLSNRSPLSRISGIVYISAIVEKLLEDPVTGKPIMDSNDKDEWTEEQEEAYAAFVEAVYKALREQDIREELMDSRPARL